LPAADEKGLATLDLDGEDGSMSADYFKQILEQFAQVITVLERLQSISRHWLPDDIAVALFDQVVEDFKKDWLKLNFFFSIYDLFRNDDEKKG
jgi:hypothetical protein